MIRFMIILDKCINHFSIFFIPYIYSKNFLTYYIFLIFTSKIIYKILRKRKKMSTHDPTKDIKRYKKDINTLKLILNNDTPSPDETSLVFEHSVHNEIEKCSRVVFFECVGKGGGGGLFKIINDATDSGVISVTYNGWGKQGRRRWLL